MSIRRQKRHFRDILKRYTGTEIQTIKSESVRDCSKRWFTIMTYEHCNIFDHPCKAKIPLKRKSFEVINTFYYFCTELQQKSNNFTINNTKLIPLYHNTTITTQRHVYIWSKRYSIMSPWNCFSCNVTTFSKKITI